MRPFLKFLGIVFISTAAFLVLAMAVLWLFLWQADQPVSLGKYPLAPGVQVEFLVESDWDVGDCLYYRVIKDGKQVVHMTYLTNHDRNMALDITTFRDANLTVAAAHGRPPLDPNFPVLVIFDLESGESWPRLRDDEVSHDPAVKAKWQRRYASLLADNPDLPRPHYFGAGHGPASPTARD